MKETYGEYLLDAATESIIECLAGITEEDVRDFSDFKIINRGQEYYEEGMVEELILNKANNIVITNKKGQKSEPKPIILCFYMTDCLYSFSSNKKTNQSEKSLTGWYSIVGPAGIEPATP